MNIEFHSVLDKLPEPDSGKVHLCLTEEGSLRLLTYWPDRNVCDPDDPSTWFDDVGDAGRAIAWADLSFPIDFFEKFHRRLKERTLEDW